MTKRKDDQDDSDTTTTVVDHREPRTSTAPRSADRSAADHAKDASASKASADRQRVAKELQSFSERLNGMQHSEFDSRVDAAKRQIDSAIQTLQQEDPTPAMTEEEALAQMAPPTLPKPNIPTEQGGQQPQPGKPDTSVVL
jgi:hypothetical protein